KSSIRLYATPIVGDMKLGKIERHNIQVVYDKCEKSPTTIRNLHAALNAFFSWTIRLGAIKHNPCKSTDRPAKTRKEIHVLTGKEAGSFIEICRAKPNGVIFEFALETGMRPEEYLAIRWADLNGREASVQQIVQYNRSGVGYYFDKPKTAKSRRMISISEHM